MVDQTSLFQSNQFQLSKKVLFLTQLSAYLSPMSKTVRNRAPLKRFRIPFWLHANFLLTFKIGNVTPPTCFPPTPTDTTSLTTQSTFTPSSPDKLSTASLEDHSASKATVFKKKQAKKATKENISELLSGNKLILEPSLKINEVIEHLTSNKII